jgi:hypothetical protein
MNPFIAAGVVINSALYLMGCFIAGLMQHSPAAWRTALAAMGVTYLCYLFQTFPAPPRWLVCPTVAASILLGAVSGLILLVM